MKTTLKDADPFRRKYRQLSDEQKLRLDAMKASAEALYASIIALIPPEDYLMDRERAIALTKLEECVMWATKAAT